MVKVRVGINGVKNQKKKKKSKSCILVKVNKIEMSLARFIKIKKMHNS